MAKTKQLKITQVRSEIGKLVAQKRTIKALGLKKIRDTVTQNDTPAIRGMINCVKHLVKVEEI
jgi:large subunit ribosomal protein L30